MEIVVVGIVAVIGLAAVFLLGTARRRAAGPPSETARPSRETGDAAVAHASEVDEQARERAEESRLIAAGGVPVPAGGRTVTGYVPVDEEELGITRRQFFNRGILTGLGLGVGAFGAASLAFLWPSSSGGFGGKVNIGSQSDIDDVLATKIPYYNAGARTYIVAYPNADVGRARKVYASNVVSGMEQGYVALYQKCPHLGCRVPFCPSSQWFECPCHGSKYNRVGEKRGGPAPRGMDRFPIEISGGGITVDTSAVVQGPPIGVDTTGQSPEGPPCV